MLEMRQNCSYRFKGKKEKTLYLAVLMTLLWNESRHSLAAQAGAPTFPARPSLDPAAACRMRMQGPDPEFTARPRNAKPAAPRSEDPGRGPRPGGSPE